MSDATCDSQTLQKVFRQEAEKEAKAEAAAGELVLSGVITIGDTSRARCLLIKEKNIVLHKAESAEVLEKNFCVVMIMNGNERGLMPTHHKLFSCRISNRLELTCIKKI